MRFSIFVLLVIFITVTSTGQGYVFKSDLIPGHEYLIDKSYRNNTIFSVQSTKKRKKGKLEREVNAEEGFTTKTRTTTSEMHKGQTFDVITEHLKAIFTEMENGVPKERVSPLSGIIIMGKNRYGKLEIEEISGKSYINNKALFDTLKLLNENPAEIIDFPERELKTGDSFEMVSRNSYNSNGQTIEWEVISTYKFSHRARDKAVFLISTRLKDAKTTLPGKMTTSVDGEGRAYFDLTKRHLVSVDLTFKMIFKLEIKRKLITVESVEKSSLSVEINKTTE